MWISEKIKGAIKSEYDQQLETHKAGLKSQADVELERLRTQLSIAASEHQVRFLRLHEMRAEFIAEVYANLRAAYEKLGQYTAIYEPGGIASRPQRAAEFAAAYDALFLYHRKAIFLPQETVDLLDSVATQLRTVYNEFAIYVDRQGNDGDVDRWINIHERLSNEVTQALGALAQEFRALLGGQLVGELS